MRLAPTCGVRTPSHNIGRAEEDLEPARHQFEEMEQAFQAELDAKEESIEPPAEALEEIQIRPGTAASPYHTAFIMA